MQKLITLFILSALLSACGSGPGEDELKEKLSGVYCNGMHKLELRGDGTYLNQRFHKGALTGRPVMERCEGTYKFEWDGGQKGWMLVLEKSSDNSTRVTRCNGSRQLVWKDDKYVGGDKPALKEMFDNLEVTKGGCE